MVSLLAALSTRSFEPEAAMCSVKTNQDAVDDWFESGSKVSDSKQPVLTTANYVTSQPGDTNLLQENLFQPIKDNNTNTTQRRILSAPSIVIDTAGNSRRSSASHMANWDIFARTSEPKIRHLLSSPITTKPPTGTSTVIDHHPSKTTAHSSSQQPISATHTFPITERRMSDSSVRELSPDDSDEN